MNNTESVMELIAGYETYTDASEVSVSSASDAPATTPGCAISFSIASAFYGLSFGMGGVTLDHSC
jgi:hypothetical protein